MNDLKDRFLKTLAQVLPDEALRSVHVTTMWDGTPVIRILIAAGHHSINAVDGQYPQRVSLAYTETDGLMTAGVGGFSGNIIYRKPNLEHPREKYLAMVGVKIPFRRTKPGDHDAANRAVKRFAEKWLQTLKQYKPDLVYGSDTGYYQWV